MVTALLTLIATLHSNQDVLGSKLLDGSHKAVLYGLPTNPGELYSREKLCLYIKSSGGWRRTSTLVTSDKEEVMSDGKLFAVRARKGISIATEVIYPSTSGGRPASLHLVRVDADRISETDRLGSNQLFQLKTRGNGEPAFLDSYEIGSAMSHAKMPRWNDPFVIRSWKFVEVQSGLEPIYRTWVRRLAKTLSHFADEDVWAFYGVALRRAGLHRSPSSEARRFLAGVRRQNYSNDFGAVDPESFWRAKTSDSSWPKPGLEARPSESGFKLESRV